MTSGRKTDRFLVHAASFFVVLLLTAACATKAAAPARPQLPQWEAVPPALLETLCGSFRDEGISAGTTMNVVRITQPLLITAAAMQALADDGFYHGTLDPARAADRAVAEGREIAVGLPRTCAWRAIDPQSGGNFSDTMTLELSPPLANPYGRNGIGMFARVSLGGEAPTWYWLPLVAHGETWTTGRLKLLGYRQ